MSAKKRKLLNIKFPFLITIFSLFSFIACGGCSSVPEMPLLKIDKNKKDAKPNHTPNKPTTNLKKVIVLFHGLGAPRDTGIAALEKRLKDDIKNSEIIILDRENSGIVPTTQQADEAYQNLKRELDQRQLAGSPICLFGDSQGGLVVLELYRKYKEELNIKGIVTNHTPLEGTPSITIDDGKERAFKDAIKNIILESENPILKLGVNMLDSISIKQVLTQQIKQTVRNDLTKPSPLLSNIKLTLENTQIPVLILAGKVDIKTGITELLNFVGSQSEKLKPIVPLVTSTIHDMPVGSLALNNLETAFGTAIGSKENDCFLPFYSQIARSIPDHPKIERFSSRSYHHFYGTVWHVKVYNKLRTFINQVFEAKEETI
jgi:hypothetical protein